MHITTIRFFAILTSLFFAAGLYGQKQSISTLMYQTISEKGVQDAVKEYHSLKKSEADKYEFSEGELNNLGYRLLGENNPEAAIEIFELNTRMFPDSPNTYDSLGEALMRNGYKDRAIESYEKALKTLEKASLPEQQQQFLTKNAENKLKLLRNKNRIHSTAISELIVEDAEHPFGKLHPEAPPETGHWGHLAGLWECTNYAFVNGQWLGVSKAQWAWRYILDGFAIQDNWMQKAEDLPMTSANPHRDFAGTNLRIYDRVNQKWDVMWLHNGQSPTGTGLASSHMEAFSNADSIVMKPVGGKNAAGQTTRVVFHNMTADNFDWRSDISEDDGKTWKTQFKIKGKRIR